jgi:anaphase-promoting complex subunit 3
LPAPAASVSAALAILRPFGEAARALSACRLPDVQAALASLPRAQAASAAALALLGRALLESGAHAAAAAAFERGRAAAPGQPPARLASCDAHSTALWHTRSEPALDALAAACLAADRHSPVSLVVAANALSLRRDHAGALAYLGRACAVAPRYAYAHTLAGHERLALGDADGAKASFRAALRHDARHYNALFGVGAAFVREEKFAAAEVYFRKALAVNPASPALLCYLAMALNAQKRHADALATLDRAAALAPALPQVAYQRAAVHLAVDDLARAEAELRKVLEAAPAEPTTLVLLGKVCKGLGKTAEAVSGDARTDAARRGARRHTPRRERC